jgi:hypothetical protein
MPDIKLLMLSIWSGRVVTEGKTRISCRLMWWRSTGKGTVNCTLLWMRYTILRPGCRGQRWGRYWCMWGWNESEWVDRRGCGPAGGQWDNRRRQSRCRKCQGLWCGAGLRSAWLGLPAIGWVATEWRICMSCRLMWWRGAGKGTTTCALLWMRSMILRPGCRGQRWGRYWCMWGWNESEWVDRRGCGPAGSQWDDRRRQSSYRKWQGLRCRAGLRSAWLGLPAIGWVVMSKN